MSLENLLNIESCAELNAGYPCGENPINIVSLSLACSGLALIMVSFNVYVILYIRFLYISISNMSIDNVFISSLSGWCTRYVYLSLCRILLFTHEPVLIVYILHHLHNTTHTSTTPHNNKIAQISRTWHTHNEQTVRTDPIRSTCLLGYRIQISDRLCTTRLYCFTYYLHRRSSHWQTLEWNG